MRKPPIIKEQDGTARIRQKSSRALAKSNSVHNNENGIQQAWSQLQTTIKDQWRRMTQSACDPYVKVELRPRMVAFIHIF